MAILTLRKGNGIVQPTKWCNDSNRNITALSRGILKQKKGKSTIHCNGDSLSTEFLFQTIHSVNQLSVYGAVANWCHQFGLTEEEKGRVSTPVDNKISTKLKPEEVQLLVSPPNKQLKTGCEKTFELRRTGG